MTDSSTGRFRPVQRLVKGDFGLRRFEREAGVPRAAIGAVEAAAKRMRVAERRVDDVRKGTPKTSSSMPMPGSAVAPQQAIVGRAIELEDVLQVRVIVRDARQDALAAAGNAMESGDACRTGEPA